MKFSKQKNSRKANRKAQKLLTKEMVQNNVNPVDSDNLIQLPMVANTQKRPSVLTCITSQRDCDRLIAAGAAYAQRHNLPLLVLSVQPPGILAQQECSALEHLFQIASQYSAEMSVFYNADPTKATSAYIKRRNIVQIFTGTPSTDGDYVPNLQQHFAHIPLTVMPPRGLCEINEKEELAAAL